MKAAVVGVTLFVLGCGDLPELMDSCEFQSHWRDEVNEGFCAIGWADENTRLRLEGQGCEGWTRELELTGGETVELGARNGHDVSMRSVDWEVLDCNNGSTIGYVVDGVATTVDGEVLDG